MHKIHPNRDSYEEIWKKIIWPEINNYQMVYLNHIEVIPNVMEEIWNKYVYLNNYCKNNYMYSSVERIDRHKVAACYMIAIATTKPMIFVDKINNKNVPLAINETLAITVGFSLVRAFAISAINENKQLEDEEKKQMIAKFKEGIQFPKDKLVNHGDYIENFANEIYYMVQDGKISILSLAHELYLLEVITRIQ